VELTGASEPAGAGGWALVRALPRRWQIVVAASTAVLTVACFLRFGFGGRAFVGAVFAATLVLLTATDFDRRLIPNAIVLPATVLVLLAQIALFPERTLEWVLATLGAALFFFIPALIVPAGMGMGDVKLAALLGAALGKSVIGAILVGLQGMRARRKAIAYGPFLAFGGLLVLLLGGR
jgi:leader peptidase (prepilin peptidase)/N-methyltransferase